LTLANAGNDSVACSENCRGSGSSSVMGSVPGGIVTSTRPRQSQYSLPAAADAMGSAPVPGPQAHLTRQAILGDPVVARQPSASAAVARRRPSAGGSPALSRRQLPSPLPGCGQLQRPQRPGPAAGRRRPTPAIRPLDTCATGASSSTRRSRGRSRWPAPLSQPG
jgi:hypothetical protein